MSGVSFQTRVDTKDGHKRGFDWFWQVMLELDRKGDWTTTDVARRSVVPGNTVLTYAARLEKGGYIRRTGTRPAARRQSPGAAATTWRIVRPVARAPRLDPDGNERPEPINQVFWRTMKMLKTFTAQELALHASTEERPVKAASAKAYLSLLHAAGVTMMQGGKGKAPGVHTLTGLIEGDQAPRIVSAKLVFDPNTGEVLGGAFQTGGQE
ncbi:MAG: hypothetical protein CMJ42_03905 [Phyllobacteriaceae bacterium]|nr:hypothetical protein [Phyllobacteriaceae bacterium]MBA92894.1 hypothetical protein [Phyllobacteriaceae bacterium]